MNTLSRGRYRRQNGCKRYKPTASPNPAEGGSIRESPRPFRKVATASILHDIPGEILLRMGADDDTFSDAQSHVLVRRFRLKRDAVCPEQYLLH